MRDANWLDPNRFFVRHTLGPLMLLIVLGGLTSCRVKQSAEDEFTNFMNVGKNYYDKGEPAKAIDAFAKAVTANPTHPDAHLNLANAYLLAGQSTNALRHAQEVLNLDAGSAAAHYVKGCAYLRLSRFEEAAQSLQESLKQDAGVGAVHFQLGLAQQNLKRWDDAIACFQQIVDMDTNHPAAHYNLSQALIRAGRQEEANQHLELHRQIAATTPGPSPNFATYERCVHTQARVPFMLEQPERDGVKVTFADVSKAAFAPAGGAQNLRGPVGVIDVWQDGHNDLFVTEGTNGFRLLINTNGIFTPHGDALPAIPGATYSKCLVGDLNNTQMQSDRTEDLIVLGPQGSHVFKFATNGAITETSAFARLNNLSAIDGGLVDIDFTGSLDVVAVTSTNTLRVFRNLGSMYFKDITATSGVPASLTVARELVIDDWDNDDLMDLFVARNGEPPMLLAKQRGGPFVSTNLPPDLPNNAIVALGDLNNDLRADLIVASAEKLECIFNGTGERVTISPTKAEVRGLTVIDYDNDGWLDICASGDGLRMWRNQGRADFKETTEELRLAGLKGNVKSVTVADFDHDCDSDLLLDLEGSGLRLLRNDGGNANHQLKLRLLGNRSNPSGLGTRVEITVGGLRAIRTVHQLPIEIGVGRHELLNAMTVHWFDLAWNQVDVKVECKEVLPVMEMILPSGSCPYLYAWDGERFRFISDILGASPAGLPVAEGRYIEADPDEYVWMGDDTAFKPRGENYVVQITEELREVLYLDEAKLVVVDHPAGTEVYPTDKLLPGKPFPPSELIALHRRTPLRHALRSDGQDVTAALQEADQTMVSPIQLRAPQLRGLAEPFSVTLDFGPLAAERPLVLALTGWLRFGGGMANIAASLDPELPFPFPKLEAETADGRWVPVPGDVGAPAGKTKRMIVDLSGKLPPHSKRLRLSTAFEIHWDQAALFERADAGSAAVVSLAPDTTDLHWRGFSEFEELPWYQPLTPDYGKVRPQANWRITPAGWCTRYGDVKELIAKRDDALALLNGGDELTLTFDAKRLPNKPPGFVRDFFIFTVGWDKDADFHVARGTTVEPLPFHGMDDQRYGELGRPATKDEAWVQKYNTRWVGPLTLRRERR
ncbi:MAG: VCBS repeat-containing protein [Verrucomicrobia bacterium]|nr:VCBS repeat-containing protein [Verrucomicrobiota bacterium]